MLMMYFYFIVWFKSGCLNDDGTYSSDVITGRIPGGDRGAY